MLARDLSGTPLTTGGAVLKLTVEQNQLVVEGSVADDGTGAYVGSYTLTTVGPYQLTLSLHSSAVTFSGVCEPGVTHTPR